jgi:Ni,Fe-hydrogenase III large subunit/Ni,Fe-hydrogenase III component G
VKIPGLHAGAQALPGAAPASHTRVDAPRWEEAARLVREGGGRLVALWGADNRDRDRMFAACAAFAVRDGLAVIELPISEDAPAYPDLSGLFPAADRMQRAAFDLLGIYAQGASDKRPWIRHGAWREDEFPLRRDFDARAPRENAPERYPFVRVEGDGVHEMPVGPVHAGIIEPGHFRFSVVGEKVLRLEERLAYTHKGADKRFEAFTLDAGHRLAGRICGDSTVAYAWAYAQATESILGITPPPRASWLRALMLERERVANHLGDLGGLGNDGGLGFAFAQFMRLKEQWLRLSHEVFGHRFMMDCIVPGGVTGDVTDARLAGLLRESDLVEAEVRTLQDIFDEHSGLQDRFLTAGRVTPDLARKLGLTGLAGRSSGQAFDLRADFPVEPYHELAVRKVVLSAGDVAARVHARFDEVHESLRLMREVLARAPHGTIRGDLHAARSGFGVGWIEGWRGEVFVAIEAEADGRIRRAHVHDPSWQNWPVVEHAVIGNIVPDFPLINKSFNLAYSGYDC